MKLKIVWIPRNILAAIFLIVFGLPIGALSIAFEKLSDWLGDLLDVIMKIADVISGRK